MYYLQICNLASLAGTALYAGNAIQQQADHIWNNASETVQKDYGKENFDAQIKKMIGYVSGGVSISEL